MKQVGETIRSYARRMWPNGDNSPLGRKVTAVSLYVVAVCIPLVFGAELTDKTMFATLVLATRGRPREVWLGAAVAFLAQVSIAVSVGPLLMALIPRSIVTDLLAATCIVGGLLAWRSTGAEGSRRSAGARFGRSTFLYAFCIVFLAEIGDLTQVLIVGLTTRYGSPASVAVGAVLALWLSAALAVAGARPLLLRIRPGLLQRLSGAIFVTFGVATILTSAF